MTDLQVAGLVAAAMADVLDIDPALLRLDTPLIDVGVDSMVRIGFADCVEAKVREQLHVAIAVDDESLSRATTVGDLADHVEVLLGAVTVKETP